MFCIHCGKEIPDDSVFCIFCGKPVNKEETIEKKTDNVTGAESTEIEEATQSEKKKDGVLPSDSQKNFIRLALIATTGIIVCVLILIAIPSLSKKGEDISKSSVTSVQTTDDIQISSSQASGEGISNYQAGEVKDEYIIPNSDKELLKENDLKKLSAVQLTYARNEIYARHGYIFESAELNSYFRKKTWYSPLGDNSKVKLNGTEEANAKFIKDYQNVHGLSYTPSSSSAIGASTTNNGYIPAEFEITAQCDLVKKGDYYYIMPKSNVPIKSYDGSHKVDYSFNEGIRIAKDAKVGVAVKCEPGGDQAVYTYEYYDFYAKVEELFNKSHWKNTKDGLMFSVNGNDLYNMVLIQVNTQGEIVELKDSYNP